MSEILAYQQSTLLGALMDVNVSNAINSIAITAGIYWEKPIFDIKNQSRMERGLLAYRANASESAARSLAATYPVIAQLLGEEVVAHLARDLWRAHPPDRGDLAQWGGALAEFFKAADALQDLVQAHPFLPDVARLEWALHCAANAQDTSLDTVSLQLLAQRDPQRLQLELSAGCALIPSAFPHAAIVHLHDPRYADEHAAATGAVQAQAAQTALVWRRGLRPMFRSVDAAESALLQSVWQGSNFAQCVDAALVVQAQFDLGAWLSASVQSGLVCAVREI
jgi:Putative DNA-binding domain